MHPFSAANYLDLSNSPHAGLFSDAELPVWSALPKITTYLREHLRPAINGDVSEQAFVGSPIFIGEGTVVEPGATIKGPVWIGKNCTVRSGAYIRENVIVGDGCLLGNSSEFKNCILFDEVDVPHFSYVGDSIMGCGSHLGAGVILSNVKLDSQEVQISHEGGRIATGLRKFGAIIGDGTEIGSNSVVSPGSILGKDCILYPGTHWHGVLDHSRIVKVRQTQEIVTRVER
ncbi:MAG: NDP-sugar pyrophosphorylase family protein [Verrucomicrobiales bacterium]|jgi:NDP-sugar pyrophosphorylase family protein